MSRLLTVGFESGTVATATAAYDGESDNSGIGGDADMGMIGTVSYQNSVARNSGYAMQCNPSAANYQQISGVVLSLDVPIWTRFYVRANDDTPSQTSSILQWRLNTVPGYEIQWKTDGTLIATDANGTQIGSPSAALSANTWYRIETKLIVPTAGNGTVEVRINGLPFVASSSVDVNNSIVTPRLRLGHLTAGETTQTLYFDDVAINDSSGANQNDYPGPGNISLLVPAVDTSIGTGWEAPQTTGSDVTNIYDAVNNIPPIGVAHADTDANANKYIFNAANLGAASAYRATCLAPVFAGLESTSTIVLSQAYMRGSSDSLTGTNNMELQGITPSDSTVTCNVELTAVANTEPTGWKSFRTAVTYSPALTYITTPVVEVRKILTGAARAHMVDQMGLLIEWKTPLSATIGQVTETDTAQSVTAKKTLAVGQTTETDEAQPVTGVLTGGVIEEEINQVEETDTAQSFSAKKTVTIGQAFETDVAQPVSTHTIIGHVTETDTAQAVTSRKTVTINQASETNTAQTVTVNRTLVISQVSETDTSQSVTAKKTVAINQVEEIDEAQTHTSHKTLAVNQVEEIDEAQPVAPIVILSEDIGQTEETDEAQAVTAVKSATIGQVEEVDEALSVVTPQVVEIGQVEEIDEAHPVTTHTILGIVIESDTAQPVTANKTLEIGQAEEIDTIEEPLQNSIKSREIGRVIEGSTARPVSSHKVKVIDQVVDTETAQIITPVKHATIGRATETDTAQAVSHYKVKTIGQAEEFDEALTIRRFANPTNIYLPGLVTLNEDQFTNLEVIVNIIGFTYDFNSQSSIAEQINSLNFESIEVNNNLDQPTILNNFDAIEQTTGISAARNILGIRLLGGLGIVPLNDDQYVTIDALESVHALVEKLNLLEIEEVENRINIDEPTSITRIVSVEKLNGIQYDIITRGLEEATSSLGVEAL